MITYKPADVAWEVLQGPSRVLEQVYSRLSDERAEESRDALRLHVCRYFSAVERCDGKALNISPMGACSKGKIFKVRWALPGMGKSGGLRLILIAKCPNKHVVIAGAFLRRDDPSDREIEEAIAKAP